MNVLALTILVSVFLAVIFIVCFIAEQRKPRTRGLEQQALVPLDDSPLSTRSTVNKIKKANGLSLFPRTLVLPLLLRYERI